MRTRLWLALLNLVACAAAAHAADSEGGEGRPASWLTWLYSLRVGGHPLISDPAELSFAFALVVVFVLIVAAILGARKVSVRPGPFQVFLETAYGALQTTVEGVIGPSGAKFPALHRQHLSLRLSAERDGHYSRLRLPHGQP